METHASDIERIFSAFDLESIIRTAFDRYFRIQCRETKERAVFCTIRIRKSSFDKEDRGVSFTIPNEKRNDPSYTHSIIQATVHGIISKLIKA